MEFVFPNAKWTLAGFDIQHHLYSLELPHALVVVVSLACCCRVTVLARTRVLG